MPTDLSQNEVWDRLRTSMRSAIDLCGKLAAEPAQGPNYLKIIQELRFIEGASRQMATMRADSRWTWFGFEMARFHDRIGDAIRAQNARSVFTHMQGVIRDYLTKAEKAKDAKTGRRGPILPRERAGPLRHRPVYYRAPSGLLLPS